LERGAVAAQVDGLEHGARQPEQLVRARILEAQPRDLREPEAVAVERERALEVGDAEPVVGESAHAHGPTDRRRRMPSTLRKKLEKIVWMPSTSRIAPGITAR